MEKNRLVEQNMTLKQFLDSNFEQLKQVMDKTFIYGERQVRLGKNGNMALQWWSFEYNDANSDAKMEVLQYQKIVIAGDLMALVTVTYDSKRTDPDYVRVLQQLISQFGVKFG